MKTNFFEQLDALQVQGDFRMVIAQNAAGKLAVSILLFNEQIGDEARKSIPPVLLNGTTEEMDEGFFDAIAQPLKETAQLFTNMEQYLKQREQAKVNSQAEKDKAVKAEKDKTDKQKKYEEDMKKAEELEAEGKFRDAWMKVPDPEQYPEHADTLRERKTELSKQFPPNLFS